MKRLFLFLFIFWSCLFSQSNRKTDESSSKSETANELNPLSEKLTPKAARLFLAEDIGRWKIKVTESTEGNPPKNYDDVMVALWEKKGKVIRYEFKPLINGKRVPLTGYKEYDANEGVFIWRVKNVDFPDYSERQTYDKSTNTLNAEVTFPNGAKGKITWLKAGKDEWRGIQVVTFKGTVVYTKETILKRMLEGTPSP
jgi:hypothetical protein